MQRHFGHQFRILHWCIDTSMTDALTQMDLTSAQGRIIGYLARQDQPPCARDIEEVFQLSHPTVSGLLSRLEKKEFIRLEPDPVDRRCKRVVLLPKGSACHEVIRQQILENEEKIVQGFTEAEREQFLSFLQRAMDNMGHHPCEHRSKEEKV